MRARTLLIALGLVLATPGTALAPPPHVLICSVSATSVSFGVFRLGDIAQSTGEITILCFGNEGETVDVALSSGQSNDYGQRFMTHGRFRMLYNLYTDFLHLFVWGDGSRGTRIQRVRLRPSPVDVETLTVYGQIPRQTLTAAGDYLDQITVTVTY